MRVNFRGRQFTLKFESNLRDLGYCEKRSSSPRRIGIRKSLKGQKLLATLLHEFGHACHPDLDEEAIDETAEDIARELWHLGWRQEKKK